MSAGTLESAARRQSLLRLAVGALVIVLLLRLLWDVEWGRAAVTLSHARLGLVALAALLNLTLNSAARVARRAALLKPLPHAGDGVGFSELTGLFFTNYAANSLLPARAGDALFVAQLHGRHGYPLGTLVGAQLAEKVVSTASLWVFAWPVVCLLALPPPLALSVDAFLGVGALGLALLAFSAREAARPAEPASPRLLDRLREALRLMHAPRVWSQALLWSCASDLVDGLMIGLCLAAVGVHAPVGLWFLVLLAVNFAMLFPATPGQVGVFEAAAVGVLRLMNVGAGDALVFALLYHLSHVVPMSVAGAIALVPSRASR